MIKFASLIIVAITFTGCTCNQNKPAQTKEATYDVSVPRVFLKSRSIPELDLIFGKAKPGSTVNLRLHFRNIGPLDGISCDDIRVDKGEVIFFSREGEFRFVPGNSVKAKPKGIMPEKSLRFNVRPNIFVNVGKNKTDEIPSACLHVNDVDWDQDAATDKSVYYTHAIVCQSTGSTSGIIELKVHFSDDYSGHIGDWKVDWNP